MVLEYHLISGTTGLYRKLHVNFEDNTMLVLCFLRPELVFLRLRSDKQTNKQTDTQTDYHNPSAHARRGLKIKHVDGPSRLCGANGKFRIWHVASSRKRLIRHSSSVVPAPQ